MSGEGSEDDAPSATPSGPEQAEDVVTAVTEVTEAPTEPAKKKKKGKGRRILSRLGCGGLVVVGLLGVALCGVGGWLLTPGGQDRITSEVEGLVTGFMSEGELEIGSLRTNLLSWIEVDDVALEDGSGRAVVSLRHARAELQLLDIFGGTVHITKLEAEGLDGDLQIDEDGNLDIVRMFASEPDPDAAPFEGLPVDLLFENIALTDSHVKLTGPDLNPIEVDDLSLLGTFDGSGLRFEVRDIDLDGTMVSPDPGPLRADGRVVWAGSGLEAVDLTANLRENAIVAKGHARDLWATGEAVDLTLEVTRLDLPDINGFVDAGLTGRVGGVVTAKGTLSELAVKGTLSGQGETRGNIVIDATADVNEPSWDGTVDVDGLRVDDLLAAVTDPLPVSVKAQISGSGATWPDDVVVNATILDAKTDFWDIEVTRASADVLLKEGIVELTGIDVAGPVGQIGGTGSFDAVEGDLHLELTGQQLDPSHLRKLNVPVELDGTRGTADVVVDMNAYAEEVDVVVEGTADVSPFYWTRDIRAQRVRGSYRVHVMGTDVDVDADANGFGVLAYGATVDRASSDGIRVEVREQGVQCSGGIQASDALYPLIPDSLVADLGRGVELDSGTGSWSVDVPFGEDAEIVVNVDVEAGSHRLLRYPGQTGTIHFGMLGDQAEITAKLDASSIRRLADLDLALDLNTLQFTFDTLQVAPEPRQTWTAVPGGGFRVDGLGVTDLSLDLRSAVGELDVSGTVGLEGRQDLRVEVYDLDLEAVARLLPMWIDGLEGYAGGIVTLGGTANDPDLDGEIEVADVAWTQPATDEDPAWQVVRGVGARLTLDGTADRLGVRGRGFVDGNPLADIDTSLPVTLAFDRAGFDPRGDVSADILLLSGGLTRFGELLGVPLPQDGSVQAQLVLQGTPVAPVGKLTLDASVPVQGLDGKVVLDARLDKRADGELTWRAHAKEGGQQRLSLTGSGTTEVDRVLVWALEGGTTPTWTDPELFLADLQTSLVVEELPVASLAQVAQTPLDVDGTITGKLEVGGSVMQPRVDGRLAMANGRAATVLIQNTELILASSDKGYDVALTADMEQDLGGSRAERIGSIYVDGTVPLVVDFSKEMAEWERGDLDIRAAADVPLALAAAYDSGVREGVGYLQLDGHLGGRVFDPEPSLTLTSSQGASLTYRPIGIRFRDLVVDVAMNQHVIQVNTISAETRASRVRVDTAISGVFSGAVQGGEEAVSGLRRLFSRKKKRKEKQKFQLKVGRGKLEFDGRAALNEWLVEDLDLKLQLDQALLLSTSEQYLRLSTLKPLTVSGAITQPKVRGSVQVDEANLFLDLATALGGSAMEIDPRIVVHRGTEEISTEVAEASLFDDVDIELYLDLGRATRGRMVMPLEAIQWLGAQAEALLKVDLRARLSNDDALVFRQVPCRAPDREGKMKPVPERQGACGLYHPQVRGIIDIVDGAARVLRADFTLTTSKVSFLGSEVYNPNLDIHGEMRTDDTTITMDIGGTAYDPDVKFNSAENPDQVFAMLALGTSLDDLTAQQVASTLAFALLNSALTDVNLPSVNIDPSGQVSVGIALGRNAFVEFVAGGTPRPDENVFEAELEYSLDMIARGLLLKAGYGAYAIPFWGDVLIERKFD